MWIDMRLIGFNILYDVMDWRNGNVFYLNLGVVVLFVVVVVVFF